MPQHAAPGWNRREFLEAASLLALAVGAPVAAIRLSRLDPAEAPSQRQRVLMRQVSQLVIPRDDTPGAGDVGIGDFVLLALAHGLEGSRRPLGPDADPRLLRFRRDDASLDHAGWLEAELDRRAGGDFLAGTLPAQARALSALDAEAYAANAGDHPWKVIKALVLTGYYTSEPGGAHELRYELVPGRFDPDLPLKPGDRAWSSDWTAVDFG